MWIGCFYKSVDSNIKEIKKHLKEKIKNKILLLAGRKNWMMKRKDRKEIRMNLSFSLCIEMSQRGRAYSLNNGTFYIFFYIRVLFYGWEACPMVFSIELFHQPDPSLQHLRC